MDWPPSILAAGSVNNCVCFRKETDTKRNKKMLKMQPELYDVDGTFSLRFPQFLHSSFYQTIYTNFKSTSTKAL